MIQAKKTFQQLTSKGVCQIYELLHEHRLVSFPINQESVSKVDAIVANINGINFGVENYKTIEEKLAAYLYFIIKDHAFTDGNKRTAVLAFQVVCDLNNIAPDSSIALDSLAVYIENHRDDNHQTFIKALSVFLFDKKQ